MHSYKSIRNTNDLTKLESFETDERSIRFERGVFNSRMEVPNTHTRVDFELYCLKFPMVTQRLLRLL